MFGGVSGGGAIDASSVLPRYTYSRCSTVDDATALYSAMRLPPPRMEYRSTLSAPILTARNPSPPYL
jgi:hypothetical protein